MCIRDSQYSDGKTYTGEWKRSKMNGRGVTKWSDGRYYEGEYIDDKKQGQGKFLWPDGKEFIGYWKNGRQHGIGTVIMPDGEKKTGEWIDGRRIRSVSYTHLRAHETPEHLVCRLLLEKKNNITSHILY
eukprot:TRINITY_DN7291_c0_g1_i2.p2 TRINITY_DN7291_c0_g1~~TRINITY_DN7291_c0_g1_i2.p2  ORF type:complete len:129 (+),score=49.44 TRINITY_DN7291_c0_g1_i2:61-447(+)